MLTLKGTDRSLSASPAALRRIGRRSCLTRRKDCQIRTCRAVRQSPRWCAQCHERTHTLGREKGRISLTLSLETAGNSEERKTKHEPDNEGKEVKDTKTRYCVSCDGLKHILRVHQVNIKREASWRLKASFLLPITITEQKSWCNTVQPNNKPDRCSDYLLCVSFSFIFSLRGGAAFDWQACEVCNKARSKSSVIVLREPEVNSSWQTK